MKYSLIYVPFCAYVVHHDLKCKTVFNNNDMSTVIVFVYLGLQVKWNESSSNNSHHTSSMHKGLHDGKWPDLMTSQPDSVSTLGYHCVLTNFPYKLLWTIMDTLWTVVITQPQLIVVGKHFTVTIMNVLNVISRIPVIHLLPIYVCTNSWNVLSVPLRCNPWNSILRLNNFRRTIEILYHWHNCFNQRPKHVSMY